MTVANTVSVTVIVSGTLNSDDTGLAAVNLEDDQSPVAEAGEHRGFAEWWTRRCEACRSWKIGQ